MSADPVKKYVKASQPIESMAPTALLKAEITIVKIFPM